MPCKDLQCIHIACLIVQFVANRVFSYYSCLEKKEQIFFDLIQAWFNLKINDYDGSVRLKQCFTILPETN